MARSRATLVLALLALPLAAPAEEDEAAEEEREEVAEEEEVRLLQLRPGHSVVLELDQEPEAFSVTDETVARAVQLSETVLQVQGVAVGTTDLAVTYDDADTPIVLYDITVQRDVAPLQRTIDDVVSPPEE